MSDAKSYKEREDEFKKRLREYSPDMSGLWGVEFGTARVRVDNGESGDSEVENNRGVF